MTTAGKTAGTCPIAKPRRILFRPFRALLALWRHRDNLIEAACAAGETVDGVTALRTLRGAAFLFREPAAVREILVQHRLSFRRGVASHWLRGIVGESILAAEDVERSVHAPLIKPAFTRQSTDARTPAIIETVEQRLGGWRVGQRLDVAKEMHELTLEVVVHALFGRRIHATELPKITRALNLLNKDFGTIYLRNMPGYTLISRLPWTRNRRFDAALGGLDEVIYEWIDDRVGTANADAPSDLLDRLAREHREAPDAVPRRQIRDQMVGLMVAGHETTGAALTWLWHLLGAHPEVEARVHAEIDQVFRGGRLEPEQLRQLPYVTAVFNETLRLYPPAYSLGRMSAENCEIDGNFVPAGSSVSLCPVLTQRDSRFFSEPLQFDPERWMRGDVRLGHDPVFFPFGFGPRSCLGESLARREVAIIVSLIAQRWRLRPTSGEPLRERTSVTLTPTEAPPMILETRAELSDRNGVAHRPLLSQ